MNQSRDIIFPNGCRLTFTGEWLVCYDESDHVIKLTRGQEKLLNKLANNVNSAVSMSALYEAYAYAPFVEDNEDIRENVTKMKNTLPGCIKGYIKSVRGYGYKLIDTNSSQARNIEKPTNLTGRSHRMVEQSNISGLVGDYYGFCLDPVGNGAVLGAYIHIENRGDKQNPDITVSAVLGIRNDDILLSERLAEVFSGAEGTYHRKFKDFISTHSANNKRCFWAEGKINVHGNVAEIALRTPIDAKWNIWMDIGSYLDRRQNDEDYRYKGGIGLAVALTPSYGTFCCKFGLVREVYLGSSVTLNDSDLKQMLRISDNTGWNPLSLDVRADRYWYNWFMTE